MEPAGPPPMPGWVRVFLAVLAGALLLAVLLMVLSGGEHSPWRHVGG